MVSNCRADRATWVNVRETYTACSWAGISGTMGIVQSNKSLCQNTPHVSCCWTCRHALCLLLEVSSIYCGHQSSMSHRRLCCWMWNATSFLKSEFLIIDSFTSSVSYALPWRGPAISSSVECAVAVRECLVSCVGKQNSNVKHDKGTRYSAEWENDFHKWKCLLRKATAESIFCLSTIVKVWCYIHVLWFSELTSCCHWYNRFAGRLKCSKARMMDTFRNRMVSLPLQS